MANSIIDVVEHLVPVPEFKSGFTTSRLPISSKIKVYPLDDKVLGVHKVSSRTSHKRVDAPATPTREPCNSTDPDFAWEAFYAKGSTNPSSNLPGGFGFYLSGPTDFAKRLETATEALFSYRMRLEEEWEWVRGGKLPGIFGGVGPSSYGCSGGRQDDRCKCFDLRPMWREHGAGEMYVYLPMTDKNKEVLLNVPPRTIANDDFGYSVGRGAYNLDIAVGRWMTVATRVKLNSPGSTNGEFQLWVDGKSVINVRGLAILDTDSPERQMRGMHFQTFFGGSGPSWASTRDQKAWFADVTGVIIQ